MPQLQRARRAKVVLQPAKRSETRGKHRRTWKDLQVEVLHGPDDACILVLCGSQFPGNLGTIMRTCALLDIRWVCVLGYVTEDHIRKAFRAAQVEKCEERGETWNIHVVTAPRELTPSEALAELKENGFHTIGLTDATDAAPIWRMNLVRARLALVFGQETGGIPSQAERVLDVLATVPQAAAGCLNVSQAASMVTYERYKQQQERLPQLPDPPAKRLRILEQ